MSQQGVTSSPERDRSNRELIICLICLPLLAYLFLGWSQSPLIIALDQGFFDYFNGITRQSWALDMLLTRMFETHTAKIVPLMACVVWLLFQRRRDGRSTAFFGQMLLGSVLAMTLARLIQNFSSHRPRPFNTPDLVYELPFGVHTTTLTDWSSFPSDTSSLTFAIATGIFLASRRLGLAALVWAAVVVAFPRAYAGLHYPSDLIGGALIGLVCTAGLAPLMLRALARRVVLTVDETWLPFLWAAGFLLFFQISTLFEDIRRYGGFAMDVLGF